MVHFIGSDDPQFLFIQKIKRRKRSEEKYMSTEEKKSWGNGGFFASRDLGSIMLLVLSPVVCFALWSTCKNYKGSFTGVFDEIVASGPQNFLMELFQTPFDPYACKMILSYMAFELCLMRLVPGKEFKATPTLSGHVPIYKANGFQSYLITIVALFALKYSMFFNPADVYDNMGKILSSLNFFALALCCCLTIKGLTYPSTKDSGSNGSLIQDFFWGTELYPRVLGFDVKQFTNSRFGVMFWQVGIICYAFKQYDLYGHVSNSMLVSVLIQSVYLAKFYYWETGYFCSMDIQHDRAGYYICWGCLVWVPCTYTLATYYLVEHPVALSSAVALSMLLAGVLCIWINYDCDRQRQDFRQNQGAEKIWGQAPDFIKAKYLTKDGEERTSLLLCSGYWALSRHFHYIPEILASFFWCVPALFTHPIAYFYPVYLTLLLVDRASRDDARCADKYNKSWAAYCSKVPYKIVPGVY